VITVGWIRVLPKLDFKSQLVFLIGSGWVVRNKHLRLGGSVCLPSSCSTTKVQSFVNDFLERADLQIAKDYDQSEWCLTNESQPFDTLDIVCM
jgi:hypothetical protein